MLRATSAVAHFVLSRITKCLVPGREPVKMMVCGLPSIFTRGGYLDAAGTRASLALATDFPAIWRDPNTPQRERKRMLALVIEDVTLIKRREITVAIRFRGGATTSSRPPPWYLRPQNPGGHFYLAAVSSQRRNGPTSKRLEWRFVCDAGEMARESI
jgi:hypothetical protein